MDQSQKDREHSMETANNVAIYKLILVGILIGIVGVYLRFAFDSTILSIVSWAILVLGIIVTFKGVFKILNAK
ncbi:MAG: hypothetical protein V4541_03300 [Bacteroidota bacterium]